MPNIQVLRPDPRATQNGAELLNTMLGINPFDTSAMLHALESMKLASPPPRVLPCANNNPYQYRTCPNEGKRACSACKLVSYCSKECQHAHWRTHEEDCKHKMRSTKWKPEVSYPEAQEISPDRPSMLLWGRLPAVDIINLSNTENETRRNYRIALAASGDLRNVIATVNSLPDRYFGKLDVLINDENPRIVARNLTILLILTQMPDVDLAIDVALHFWYSAFLPSEYRLHIVGILTTFLKERQAPDGIPASFTMKLVNRCRAFLISPSEALEHCRSFAVMDPPLDIAQTEFSNALDEPERKRYRDLRYLAMRPSHRVAFWQYKSFGIALPHGAPNAHLNRTNPSLFGMHGEWLQSDTTNFLASWDIDQMIKIGSKHGAHSEDIFGCFYFGLTEQLRTFSEYLRRLDITFIVMNTHPSKLPDQISSDKYLYSGTAKATRFDRIYLSDTLERYPDDIENALPKWSSLLSESPHASILGEFLRWKPRDSMSLQDKEQIDQAFQRLKKERQIAGFLDKPFSIAEFNRAFPTQGPADISTYLDTSEAFQRYLEECGMMEKLAETGLCLRTQHLIIPQRIHAPIGARDDSLPSFADEDSWYHNTKLTGYSWTERFVEIAKSGTSVSS